MRLAAHGPFDAQAAAALLVAHTTPGAETTVEKVHRRLLRAPDATLVPLAVTLHDDGVDLDASAAHLDWLVPVVRRWFDLDADQHRRNAHFADDPLLGGLVRARPGLRIVGHPDGFEAALCTVIGQQISVAALRTMAGRVVATYGEPGPDDLVAFPTAATLAAVDPADLQASCGFMASRARTIVALARAVADGLALEPMAGERLVATRRDLLALPGIGPWTVDFLSLRVLGDPDAFPSGDLVLKKALNVTTDRAARELAEPWRPWRAFAALHLWTHAAYLP